MAVNDLYELTIYLSSTSSSGSLVLGYKQTGGSNDAETLKSAASFFANNQLLELVKVLAADVDTNQVNMRQVSVGDEIPGIHPIIALGGGRTGDSLPFSAAAVATKITNAPNSRFNGRFYIPGISELDQDEGTLNATIIALLVLWNVEVLKTLPTSLPQTATFEPIVISRVDAGVPRVPPIGFEIQSMLQTINMRQQRRRGTKERGWVA